MVERKIENNSSSLPTAFTFLCVPSSRFLLPSTTNPLITSRWKWSEYITKFYSRICSWSYRQFDLSFIFIFFFPPLLSLRYPCNLSWMTSLLRRDSKSILFEFSFFFTNFIFIYNDTSILLSSLSFFNLPLLYYNHYFLFPSSSSSFFFVLSCSLTPSLWPVYRTYSA